jgi:hypothetical protein
VEDKTQKMDSRTLNKVGLSATIHCLTGCSLGEMSGIVMGVSIGLGTWPTVALSVILAFIFGYSLTMVPLLRAGFELKMALKLAFSSGTASITIMEIVVNFIMVVIPGAKGAGLLEFRFWGSLVLALLIAGAAAYPVVRWLIARGKGHAVVYRYHEQKGGHEYHQTH